MLNHISDEYLAELYYKQGLKMREIALIIGCTPSAVSLRMKESGIKARRPNDYPPTQKQIDTWRENGARLGKSEAARAGGGRKNKGRRKRDYEFGGHEKKRSDGYIKVYVPDHPHSTKDGYVMKHVLVMEKSIGRYLLPDECVHHVNHVRDDNRIENLRLMTKTEHNSMHMQERHASRRKR